MSCTARYLALYVAFVPIMAVVAGLFIGCNELVQSATNRVVTHAAVLDTSITLEESPDVVLQAPLYLTISPNGKRLAIADGATKLLMVYEISTGKLITTYSPGVDLMDSVAAAMSSWPFKNVIDSNGASLLRFSQVLDEKGKLIAPEKLAREMPNRVLSCAFFNDSTIVMGAELNGMFRHLHQGKHVQGSYPVAGLIEYEIPSKRVRVRPFDAATVDINRPHVPQADVLVRRTSTGTFLTNCLYMSEINYSAVQPVLEIDANWKEIRRLGKLPSPLLDKAFRDFHSEFTIADVPGSDRVLVAFRVLPHVFDYLDGTSFRLRTSSDNQEYLNRVSQWVKDEFSISADSVIAALNFAVQNIESMGGDSLLVVLWDRTPGSKKLTLLGQEYRVTGELLRSYKIAEAEDEAFLPKVVCNVPLQRIVVVQSDEHTWQLKLMRSPQ